MKVKINGKEIAVNVEKCEVIEIKQAVQYLIAEPAATSVTTGCGIVVERVATK